MDHVYHTKLGEGHRIAIPADLCKQLGLVAGAPLAIRVKDDSFQVIPCAQIIREVQAAFAPFKQPGTSMVDELIHERRAEAIREDTVPVPPAKKGRKDRE